MLTHAVTVSRTPDEPGASIIMPRIFVYEFISGGGMWATDNAPSGSLLAEGGAMRSYLAEDFLACGCDVVTTRDSRLPASEPNAADVRLISSSQDDRSAIQELAAESDWTLLIAPEFDKHLCNRVRMVEEAGALLLGLNSDSTSLFANKQQTSDWLSERGFFVPTGLTCEPSSPLPHQLPLPVVCKPIDGAGSIGITTVNTPDQWQPSTVSQRVELLVNGQAVSTTIVCGPNRKHILPCVAQSLSNDGQFRYLGGEVPVPRSLADRAERTAWSFADHLEPGVRGFVGIDMVVGDKVVIVDVNPRPTTSYVGLRKVCKSNLAEATLKDVELEFDLTNRVRFST